MYRLLHILLVLFLLFALVTSAGAESRVFELQHRPAADVEDDVRAVLAPDSKVVAIDHALLVVAAPEELELVASMLQRLDLQPRMLKVTVEQDRTDQEDTVSVSGSGRITTGSTRIQVGRQHPLPENDSGQVLYESDSGRLALHARDQAFQQSHRVSQYLVVLEGQPGRIIVGQSIPLTTELRAACRRHGYVIEALDYQDIDTGFDVLPDVYGETVRLDIRPFMAFLDTARPREIVFQELATQVQVPLGEWFVLGGQMSRQDDVSHEIMATGRQGRGVENTIRVKVEIQY